MTDLAVCLAAGPVMHPWMDWAVAFVGRILPGVACVGVVLFTGLIGWKIPRALIRRIQAHRNRTALPPAPDNQPGTDNRALETCQQILNHQPRKEKP